MAVAGVGPAIGGSGGAGAATTQQASRVSVVGHTDLGGAGVNGPVAVVGNTAIVGNPLIHMSSAGARQGLYNPMPCPSASVKVVNLTNPASPTVAATIPVAAGQLATGVAALHVVTPSFTGDLAALALNACSFSGFFAEAGVAYWDVTNRNAPAFLGRYFADSELFDPSLPPCSANDSDNCSSSQHDVKLVQRPDGTVLSLSTEPAASANSFPSGDLRIVDVTNPHNPVQVGSFPGPGVSVFSNNGCRPFSAGREGAPAANGNRALLSYYDNGMYELNLANPAAPSQIGRFAYPNSRTVEGNATFVAEAGTNGNLALLGEEDWDGVQSQLVLRSPQLAGLMNACEAMFTLFDPDQDAQVYRRPSVSITADIVYVGLACPGDPLLSDPKGKIALFDRNRQPAFQPSIPVTSCSFAQRVKRLQADGAVGTVVAQTSASTPAAFSADGDPSGLSIPLYMVDYADGNTLRSALCPGVSNGSCNAHAAANASMLDRAGEWGSLRVLDTSNPANIVQTGRYQTPSSLRYPPDLGVYSASEVVARGNRAYAAWNSDGVRVIDIVSGIPRETGYFVPADTPDPTHSIPSKAYVEGVALFGNRVVITDVNSGLYVLDVPPPLP